MPPIDLPSDCKVVELRQYTLHPGQRDVLIELFEREFVESQEALGMALLGQFRDLDHPDTFVWMRGFADMAARGRALAGFYGGPVWMANREAANATMLDSDNVLLLRPAWQGAGLRAVPEGRAARGAVQVPAGLVAIAIFPLGQPAAEDVIDFARTRMHAVLAESGARDIAWYVTEEAPNNFPRLPVRTGEHVLVGVAVFPEAGRFEAFTGSATWARDIVPTLRQWCVGDVQWMRLVPTARSTLHA